MKKVLSVALSCTMVFCMTAPAFASEVQSTDNLSNSAILENASSRETTKGWKGPSEKLGKVYLDGADPDLKFLAELISAATIPYNTASIIATAIFHEIGSASKSAYIKIDRYYEEVSISGEFAYWRTTYTCYLYSDGSYRNQIASPVKAVYEGPQLWSLSE